MEGSETHFPKPVIFLGKGSAHYNSFSVVQTDKAAQNPYECLA